MKEYVFHVFCISKSILVTKHSMVLRHKSMILAKKRQKDKLLRADYPFDFFGLTKKNLSWVIQPW